MTAKEKVLMFYPEAESDAKGCIVPVRFKTDDLEKIAKAARKRNVTVSEWIRSTLDAAIGA